MIDTPAIKSDGQRPGHMILADHLRERGWTILTIKSHDVEPTARRSEGVSTTRPDVVAAAERYLGLFYPSATNGPTEAVNGRLEHLRGVALGFGNINHYILRRLIHSEKLQNRITVL